MELNRTLRGLRRSPGFSLGVVLVLGITTAGLLTVATAAYDLFLKPLPYPDVERLVQPSGFARVMGVNIGLSVPLLAELQADPAVAGIAAYQNTESITDQEGLPWRRARVSHNLFEVLGIRPLLGRSFTAEEGEPGAAMPALVSERVWRRRFGGRDDVIGREIHLDGEAARVAGVLPEGYLVPAADTEIWLPLQFTAEQLSPANLSNFGSEINGAVARLVPGESAASWQDKLRARYVEDERMRRTRTTARH